MQLVGKRFEIADFGDEELTPVRRPPADLHRAIRNWMPFSLVPIEIIGINHSATHIGIEEAMSLKSKFGQLIK